MQAGGWRVGEVGGGERYRVGGGVRSAGGLLGVPWSEEPGAWVGKKRGGEAG